MSKALPLLLITVILLVPFAVYSNTLFNGFVYDDKALVLENHWITDIRFVPDILTSGAWGFKWTSAGSNYYRPMMHLIFMLNYYIFGLKPWGFHLVNILLHIANSFLVFIIARRLLSQIQQSESDPVLPAFAASLLFATHPIHTEAVTWVSGLPDVSYTFFFLLSLYFYMGDKGMKSRYWLSVLSFAVSTLCKELALMLPFILMAYDFAFRRHLPLPTPYHLHTVRSLLKRYIPYFAVTGIYLGLRIYALGSFSPAKTHVKLSLYDYVINIFPLFSEYLEKLLLPLNLNVFHVLHPISSLFEINGLVSLIVTAAFIALTFRTLKKNRTAFFSLLGIALPLLPVLYIPAVGENVFAERYLYLPSFGFVLLIALALPWAVKKGFKTGLIIFFFLLTFSYFIVTTSRNIVWRDNFTLWSDTAKKSPDAAVPHNNLGASYVIRKEYVNAIDEFSQAISLNPGYAQAYFNMGVVYKEIGRYMDAIPILEKVISMDFSNEPAHEMLAACYTEIGDGDKAITHFKAAVMINPIPRNFFNLGFAYQKKGDFNSAIIQYKEALKRDPYYFEAYVNLANTYSDLRQISDALWNYQKAMEINFKDADLHYNLGLLYEKTGDSSRAISEYRKTLDFDPSFDMASNRLNALKKN